MKKLLAGIASAALIALGIVAIAPASAAGNTSVRWDKANSCGFAWSLPVR